MVITDAQRHRLHTKLDQVLGEEDAAVLTSHLPPSGWSDVARTRDLDQLETRLAQRFETMDARFDTLDARFDAKLQRELREQMARFIVAMVAVVSVAATLQEIVSRAIGS